MRVEQPRRNHSQEFALETNSQMTSNTHWICGNRPLFLTIVTFAFSVVGSAQAATPTNKVRFYMNMGTVEIELYGTQSPLNVANFLSYVDSGAYNDSIIHRTRDGATVAGSELFAQGGSFKEDGTGITPGPAVNNEFN